MDLNLRTRMTGRARTTPAVDAARSLARSLGLPCERTTVIGDSGTVNVQILPARVVARVRSSHDVATLRREAELASYLLQRGAPVVAPLSDAGGPHEVDGFAVTLWPWVEHRPGRARDLRAAACALKECHEALRHFPDDLPTFDVIIHGARDVLSDPTMCRALGDADRAFLVASADRLLEMISRSEWDPIPLHGDPHLGNAWITPEGPRWPDWESGCFGPAEWDLSCLPTSVRAIWPGIDRDLMELMDDVRSLCVAIWCFAAYDISRQKQAAARWHLERLKNRAGSEDAVHRSPVTRRFRQR